MSANRRVWLLWGIALTLVLWIGDMGSGIQVGDETWWLQISGRLNDGDAPYSDFVMGVLPLPIYLTAAATWILGLELWVAKLMIDAVIVATALLAARTARELGVSAAASALVALASIAFVVLPTITLYSPLSYFFLLATLSLVLAHQRAAKAAGQEHRTRLLLLASGAAAGASVAGKHSVGLMALAALILTLLAPSHGIPQLASRSRNAAMALAAAGLVVAIVLAPTAVTGGLDAFAEQTLDKGEYVESATVSFPDGFEQVLELGKVEPWRLRHLAVYLFPLIAFAMLGVAGARHRRSEVVPVGLFTIAAVVAAAPRADFVHIADAVPICALAIAVSGGALLRGDAAPAAFARRGWTRPGTVACGVLLGAFAAVSIFRLPALQFQHGGGPSGLPHLSGVVLSDYEVDAYRLQSEAMRAADAGEDRTTLIFPSAGLFYLLSGLENPTPYDYPALTTMRETGQREVIDLVRSGRVRRVCLGEFDIYPDLRLDLLDQFAGTELTAMPGYDWPGPKGVEICSMLVRK